MNIEQEVEKHKGEISDLKTAFKSVSDMFVEIDKKYKTNNEISERMLSALKEHADAQNIWQEKIDKFMDKLYKCIWGNGTPGIKTQLFTMWIIGGGLLAAVAYLFIIHLPK